MKKVAVIMGSPSDMPVAEKGIQILKDFDIPFEVHILSAHRTPDKAVKFAISAEEKGFGVIIAIAGMAAHLAGVMAANTVLPVIGVPVKSDLAGGLDALLSTVQMPTGIPVAAVAVNGVANASLLACEIIALSEDTVREKLKSYRKSLTESVLAKDREIKEKYNF
ncbi:MAG: 5-(carboxyamino)imidazole ribonucleotide mutase [Clostridiales bacterium]|jgi:5-(carboxyamino)imidazole ribonucleotide mutase|nr:5-(carboxyamino)imidazole ribonucleotide mutase [Clostridiales bacterium]